MHEKKQNRRRLCLYVAVVQPPGFTNTNYNGASGTFDSHSGYLRMSYGSGQKLRYVVTVPEGQQAKLIVDVTNPAYFRIRLYDFAAMFDGAEAARVLLPCNTSSYASLGKSEYQSCRVEPWSLIFPCVTCSFSEDEDYQGMWNQNVD